MATKLSDDLDSCKKQLYRAEKMIVGLQGEKDSWTETVAKLGVDQVMLTGDCLVAAGSLSYNGPFIAKFREDLEKHWRDKAKDLGIKFTPNISMYKLLGNPMTIR
jgi:dynein heavy chain